MSHSTEQFHYEVQETFEEYLSNESLVCSICMGVPKQAHTSTQCCGMMILCKGCITTYYQNGKTQCPTCNKRGVLSSQFVVNMRAQKMINALRAKCLTCEYGVSEEKTLESVLVHQEKVCENRLIVCKFCKDEVGYKQMEQHLKELCMSTCVACSEVMYSCYFEEHRKSWCNMRLVACDQGCVEKVRWCDMGRHIESSCSKTVITCHRNCGASYLRYEYGLHEMECDLVLTTCTLCPHKCERRHMEEHKKDKVLHMEYSMEKMVANMGKMSADMGKMTTDMGKMTTTIKYLETELRRVSSLNERMGSFAPLFLPKSIKAPIQGKEETMILGDLPRHYCDFCNDGVKRVIPQLFGKNYGYHFGNYDMCLDCAVLTVGSSSYSANEFAPSGKIPVSAVSTATASVASTAITSTATTSTATTSTATTSTAATATTSTAAIPYFRFNNTSLDAGATQHKDGIIVHSAHINMIGCYVTEGPDWRWGHQSGPSKTGTIVAGADTPGWIRVKWHTSVNGGGLSNTYRIGADKKYDLAYINGDDARIPPRDL